MQFMEDSTGYLAEMAYIEELELRLIIHGLI